MLSLSLVLGAWLAAAADNKYAACNLDPHCRAIANLSESHTAVMRMVREDRIECKLAGMCPVRRKTHDGGKIACELGRAEVPGVGTFECHHVDLLSFVSLADLGCNFCDGNDIWGWTDPQNGDLYAIAGTTVGTSIVRVTDPEHPVVVSWIPSHNPSATIWRDMKVDQNWLYIVADRAGQQMQYFDLSRVRGRSSRVTDEPDGVFHYTVGTGNSHNIVMNEQTHTAYAVGNNGCSGGLYSIDVSEPGNPRYRGCFSADGYTHDAECVTYDGPDARYSGKEICFGYNENTLTIVDFTDEAQPVMLSRTAYIGAAYTHQGWLSDNPKHAFLFLDDELDESRRTGGNLGFARTYLWDVRDLTNPVMRGHHDQPVMGIDHNLYVKGNYVYEANYEAGLRVLEYRANVLSGHIETEEVAYFDTFPQGNRVSFNGAWSNYPFFDGFVILQDINLGLFVLEVTDLDDALVNPPANATRIGTE